MNFSIVCNHDFRLKIKNHPNFEMDLGRRYSKKTEDGLVVDIKDLFVIQFYKEHFELIYKVGRMGPINIYTFGQMPSDQVWIFKDTQKFVLDYIPLELELDANRYLGKLIKSTETKKEEN